MKTRYYATQPRGKKPNMPRKTLTDLYTHYNGSGGSYNHLVEFVQEILHNASTVLAQDHFFSDL